MFKLIFKVRIFFSFPKNGSPLEQMESWAWTSPEWAHAAWGPSFAASESTNAQITHLCEKNVIEQQLSFRLIFSDIGVGIHPKDFRSWGQRQCLCVFNVAVVLQR